jgi:uncharacterized protein YhaN
LKIKSLHLKAYGPFTDARIDLAVAPGVVNVVSGPNEAGKSTARRATRDLLFGIPNNTSDDFRHGGPGLRLGAEILPDTGTALKIYRRKGRKETLLDAAGVPLSEAVLSPMMGNLDRDSFELMFGLDPERLRRGGHDMVSGQGEAGPIIFQAGAGMEAFHRARKALDEEVSKLFRERSQSAAVNIALQRHREALEAGKSAALSGEVWAAKCRELENLMCELDETVLRKRGLEIERRSLERIRRHLVPLVRRAYLLDELRNFAGVPNLPAEARNERLSAEKALGQASVRRRLTVEEMDRLRSRLETINPNYSLLRERDSIAPLADKRGGALQDADDLLRREADYERFRPMLADLIQQAGYNVGTEEIAKLIPPRPALAAIRKLIEDGRSLKEQARVARDDFEDIGRQLKNKQGALAQARSLPNGGTAATAINDIAGSGPLEKNLSEMRKIRDREKGALHAALKGFGLWSGTAAELAEMALPSGVSIDRFINRAEAHSRRRQELTDKIEEIRDQIATYERQVVTLQGAGAVPTETTVDERRRHRDEGWRLIRRAFVDNHEDVSAESAIFDPALPLPSAYEITVKEADEAADHLRKESERAAQFKTLTAEIERANTRIDRLRSELALVDKDITDLDRQWRAVWEPFGIVPLSPPEMKDWMQRRAEIIRQLTNLSEKESAIQTLEGEISDCRLRVSNALEELGEPPVRDESLRDALTRAQAALESIARLRLQREKLAQSVSDAEGLYEKKGRQLEAADHVLKQWWDRWASAVEPLKCSPETETAQVEALLNSLEEIRQHLEQYRDLARRIEGIRNRIDSFAHTVEELTARLAPELTRMSPPEAAQRLLEGLAQSEQALQDRRKIEQELETRADTTRELDEEIAIHSATLERLCHAGGCATAEELEQIEDRAIRNRELGRELAELDHRLLDDGEGKTLEELVAEAGSHNDLELVENISGLGDEISTLEARCQELRERKGGLETELKQYDGAETAASALQQSEFELAAAATAASDFIRARLASSILTTAVERFRKAHQAPILKTASDLFARLTLGSFCELMVEMDDQDRLVLLAVRPGGEKVGIHGLSDGARDQLYLALRLAAIGDYLDHHEAVPIIADDLLITFDDKRSTAALEILAEFAQRTQVLLFTHHAHVVEQARTVLGPRRAVIIELGATVSDDGEPQAA